MVILLEILNVSMAAVWFECGWLGWAQCEGGKGVCIFVTSQWREGINEVSLGAAANI